MASSRKESVVEATPKWLSIVGIGEDGLAGLGAGARRAITEAEFVFGGARHLDLAADAIDGEAKPWPSPFDATMAELVALRGRSVCVLASGDPFWNGVGATIARHIDADEYRVFPGPSAFSLAAARLGWALQDVETVSLHGRATSLIRPLLQHGARILALTSDGAAPDEIAGLLCSFGFGASRVHVLECLGGPSERIVPARVDELGQARFADLNIVAIEVRAGPDARTIPLAGALDDGLFEHDGQITKQEVRAVTLAALAPCRGELLWDVGAGSGSIAISWLLAHRSMRAIAVEKNADRAARIRRNADALGVPGLALVEGSAPGALGGLPTPDAVFIGGGGSGDGVTEAAMEALSPGGRMVANAVTLEMEAHLLALHARHGGTLTRIALSRAEPVGTMTGWRPAMPVTQWRWVKST